MDPIPLYLEGESHKALPSFQSAQEYPLYQSINAPLIIFYVTSAD